MHAVHRLGRIVTPASAAYSASEFEHQIRSSGARAIFTCVPLLDVALRASRVVGVPDEAIFILPMPGYESKPPFKSVDDLVTEGKGLPPISPLRWDRGRGSRQVAYLCYSSGTSGFPVSPRQVSYSVQVAFADLLDRKRS
jgi:acyl-coenzyme A synthetase/AMP-(fatty) acid ligase